MLSIYIEICIETKTSPRCNEHKFRFRGRKEYGAGQFFNIRNILFCIHSANTCISIPYIIATYCHYIKICLNVSYAVLIVGEPSRRTASFGKSLYCFMWKQCH